MINPIIIIIIIIEGPMVCTTIVLGIMTGKVSRYINIYKYKYMNTNITIYKQNIRINSQLSDLACRHHPFLFLTLSWQSLILIIFSSIMTIRISLILALIFFCIIMTIYDPDNFWGIFADIFCRRGESYWTRSWPKTWPSSARPHVPGNCWWSWSWSWL